MKCVDCKHETKYHAIKENHVLGTSHCTKDDCVCKSLMEERK